VYLPEASGKFKYDLHSTNPKILRVIDIAYHFNFCIFFASRQLGKSSIAAAMLVWATNFYGSQNALILNMRKQYAMNNLNTVRFIHSNLPPFLKTPLKGKSELKTYIELTNGSAIRLFFPSPQAKPETIGRSLTAPLLYLDEVSFIPNMREIFSSSQPAYSKASEQAKKNKSPTFIIVTATPNGVEGIGKFFYELKSNSISSDDIFDENNKIVPSAKDYITSNNIKNNFISVKYHWSEDITKDEDWYYQQKRNLNFDTRLINQEYDLLFLGSSSCIFPDEFLEKLKPVIPVGKIKLPYYSNFRLFKQLDPLDAFILSIDSATSLAGDYCAMQLFSFSKFEQIGEFCDRIGSVIKYTEIIKSIIQTILSELSIERLLVIIENNPGGSGNAIIELLLQDTTFDYSEILYHDSQKKTYGVYTSGKNKPIYISTFFDYVIDAPHLIHSQELISQFSNIEKKPNGSISASGKNHDDLFMATVIAAYARKENLLYYGKYINKILFNEEKSIILTPEQNRLTDPAVKEMIRTNEKNRKFIDMNNSNKVELMVTPSKFSDDFEFVDISNRKKSDDDDDDFDLSYLDFI
jgi:hypothetical protein